MLCIWGTIGSRLLSAGSLVYKDFVYSSVRYLLAAKPLASAGYVCSSIGHCGLLDWPSDSGASDSHAMIIFYQREQDIYLVLIILEQK